MPQQVSIDACRNSRSKRGKLIADNLVIVTRQRLRYDRIRLSHSDINIIDMKRELDIYGSFLNGFAER